MAADVTRSELAPPARIVVDANGVGWRAVELPPTPAEADCFDAALGIAPEGWLVFQAESGDERRLPRPPAWRDVTDAALVALWAAADARPVCRRRADEAD